MTAFPEITLLRRDDYWEFWWWQEALEGSGAVGTNSSNIKKKNSPRETDNKKTLLSNGGGKLHAIPVRDYPLCLCPLPKPPAVWKCHCLIFVFHCHLKPESFDLSCSWDPISWHIILLTKTFLLNLFSGALAIALKSNPNIPIFFFKKIYYQYAFTVTVKFALNSIITIFPYSEGIFGSCCEAEEAKK